MHRLAGDYKETRGFLRRVRVCRARSVGQGVCVKTPDRP